MAEIDTGPWDGGAAMSGCANSADPATAYEAICAGRKAGDPSLQSSWALPHHTAPGSPPNAGGVRNALSRLPNMHDLTNGVAAQAHLDNHMQAIQAAESEKTPAGIAELRRRSPLPRDGRVVAFPAQMRASITERNGKQFYEVTGYATVFDTPYEMYDMFGPYREVVTRSALDASLAIGPDVAFLVNHRGVTMARTTNGSMVLTADDSGLKVQAFLNTERQDVRDLMSAIDDGLIDQMSFAFMLGDGTWNKDMDLFTITQADINRGDVSAVNYGANPYTSIAARARAWVDEASHMPEAARAAAGLTMTASGNHVALTSPIDYTLTRQLGMAPDADCAALAKAIDAVLDEASELLSGVDPAMVPPDVLQAIDLLVAAEATTDALLDALGVPDPEDADEPVTVPPAGSAQPPAPPIEPLAFSKPSAARAVRKPGRLARTRIRLRLDSERS